jgi:hypothetical protein
MSHIGVNPVRFSIALDATALTVDFLVDGLYGTFLKCFRDMKSTTQILRTPRFSQFDRERFCCNFFTSPCITSSGGILSLQKL